MENEEQVHKSRNWVGTIITLAMLFFVGFFVYKVVFYAKAIQSGEIDPSSLSYSGAFSTSESLANAPLPDGEFNLVTTDDPSLGSVRAPVQIVEFADFGCPYSQDSSVTMRALAQKYPEQINYVYRDFPITELHPMAEQAAQAGECAQEQGVFWEYHDKLYQNQFDLSRKEFVNFAAQLNMNTRVFESCLDSERFEDEVFEDYTDGLEAGVRGTPTFFINGNRIPGAIPGDVLETLIQSVLSNG
ncbi:DsbA family protein [Candidatus Uhrbacteria bacterium]|jgi:protein-disulfide isomerase|nr:DsbA family protein [Candidatus Uhrbacteria bacterium]